MMSMIMTLLPTMHTRKSDGCVQPLRFNVHAFSPLKQMYASLDKTIAILQAKPAGLARTRLVWWAQLGSAGLNCMQGSGNKCCCLFQINQVRQLYTLASLARPSMQH